MVQPEQVERVECRSPVGRMLLRGFRIYGNNGRPLQGGFRIVDNKATVNPQARGIAKTKFKRYQQNLLPIKKANCTSIFFRVLFFCSLWGGLCRFFPILSGGCGGGLFFGLGCFCTCVGMRRVVFCLIRFMGLCWVGWDEDGLVQRKIILYSTSKIDQQGQLLRFRFGVVAV
jgi:hypothetical protein